MNIRLGELAWELLAWRKSLRAAEPGSPDALETERLIDLGGGGYRRLLSTLHGERDITSLAESDEWLAESRSRWRRRSEMTERGGLLSGPKLRLTDRDIAELDRVRPERSFTLSQPIDRDPGGMVDLAGQLERLGALRAEGLLTDREFETAKARVLGQAPFDTGV